jgi:DNA-binding NtrC family response regulator
MMSGHATIDTAVEATRIGAMAFLEKPITLQKLLQAVDTGLKKSQIKPSVPPRSAALVQAKDSASGAAHGVLSSPDETVLLPVQGETSVQPFNLDVPLRDARDAFEKAYFEFHLAKENGSMTRVAEKTGLERTHLYRKLKQLGVDLSRSKRNGL